MTILYLHRDGVRDPVGGSRLLMARSRLRLLVRRVVARIIAVGKIIHRAIVLARMRRLRTERMFHTDLEGDAAKFPRLPLILGDKWDF